MPLIRGSLSCWRKVRNFPWICRGRLSTTLARARPNWGKPIGSAGPTTAGRMDAFTPRLLELGLSGMIGKGYRSPEVKEALVRHGAVYLAAVGGAAALIAERIKAARVVAYEDLGPEAIRELEVVEFPALVVNDAHGGDLYEQGRKRYERKVAS